MFHTGQCMQQGQAAWVQMVWNFASRTLPSLQSYAHKYFLMCDNNAVPNIRNSIEPATNGFTVHEKLGRWPTSHSSTPAEVRVSRSLLACQSATTGQSTSLRDYTKQDTPQFSSCTYNLYQHTQRKKDSELFHLKNWERGKLFVEITSSKWFPLQITPSLKSNTPHSSINTFGH